MKRNPHRDFACITLRLTLALATMALLVVPLSFAAKRNAPENPETSLNWPEAPDKPRVTWRQSIRQPADLGAKVSGYRRTMNWFAGDNRGNESFMSPFGIALDEADNLCLTDTGLKTVSYFDRSKAKWQRWEQAGKVRFEMPVAVAKRRDTIFVADSGLAKIFALNTEGKLRFQISEKIQRPSGLAIVGERLYVADSLLHAIHVFDLSGKHISTFGKRGLGAGEFNFPTHITADRNGVLYVTDSMNSRIQALETTGKSRAVIGSAGNGPGYFSRPKGVAVDRFGHIYVLDAVFDNVQIFDGTGRLLLNLGHSGTQPGEFWLPNGIAIGTDDRIYITDSYNRRIQVLQYVGGE